MSGDLFDGWYAGRRVLVTGHTGFVGSWAARWLAGLGARVTGYSRGDRPEPGRRPAGVTDVHGDVRDAKAFDATVAEQRPELILHLAGQAIVAHGFRAPVET